MLPRTGGVEPFGIERLVGCGHRVRFVVVVDECDAIAHVDGEGRRTVLEILDVDRRDGRKQRRNGSVDAVVRVRASSATCRPVSNLLMWVHMPPRASADGSGHPKPASAAYQGCETHRPVCQPLNGRARRGLCRAQALGLEQAYALWSPLFFSVARHIISDSALAEECVHDALVRVWRAPNRFTGNRGMLKAYLVACVRNEALTTLRRESRHYARALKAARLAPVTTVDPPVVDPVETQRLQDALARLPEEQRGMRSCSPTTETRPQVEIAKEVDAPLGTIKSRISMAMRKLHAELASPGGSWW